MDCLKQSTKTQVYRLHPVAGRQSVVAKRTRSHTALLEHRIQASILPGLGVDTVGIMGIILDPDPAFSWLFMEDLGDEVFTDEHSLGLARTLCGIHSAEWCPELADLPERGPDYYLNHLRAGRARLIVAATDPSTSRETADFLAELTERLDRIQDAWGEFVAICGELPDTLVHGDIKAKNLRVRAGATDPSVVVLDWETAGWGTPAPDLARFAEPVGSAHEEIAQFVLAAGAVGSGLQHVGFALAARVGMLLRVVAAVDWASQSLSPGGSHDPLMKLQAYDERLQRLILDFRRADILPW